MVTAGIVILLSDLLATRWIEDGTADSIRRFIRNETRERQRIAAEALDGSDFRADPHAFNIWPTLPAGRLRADVVGRMAGDGLGLMPSDAFTVSGAPAEKIRVCLGGEIGRARLRKGLGLLGHVLNSDF